MDGMGSSFCPKFSSMSNTPKPNHFLLNMPSACFITTQKSANDDMEMEMEMEMARIVKEEEQSNTETVQKQCIPINVKFVT